MLPHDGRPVCFDFETVELLPDGATRASTEAYRENFRVSSCAFSWREDDGKIYSLYLEGETAIEEALHHLVIHQCPAVVHNVQFEMMVTRCRFPNLYDRMFWHADTMRLVQVYDNGGGDDAFEIVTEDDMLDESTGEMTKKSRYKPISGLGLVVSLKRILKMTESPKDVAYSWLRENVPGCKKGNEGSFLDKLPRELMEQYNIGDTENTLKLYYYITEFFGRIKYDWLFDHRLYFSTVRLLVDSKIRGVLVKRESLAQYREQVRKEIADIGEEFRWAFAGAIVLIERERLRLRIGKLKTLRGRKKYLKRVRANPSLYEKDIRFNVGSNKQLEALFVEQLGMVTKFHTDKGAPSFRSAVLGQWGEGGEMLKKRRKRLLVLKQVESLLSLSEYDGRWHLDIKAAGTATGRMAGGQA